MKVHLAVLTVVCLLSMAVTAGGQVLERPARPTRGLFGGPRAVDPDRPRQELTLTASLLAGYDDNLTPEGTGVAGMLRPRDSGYNGFADLGVQYLKGRRDRVFSATGRSYFQSYSSSVTTSAVGGEGSAELTTDVGLRNSLTLSQTVASTPFFSLGTFAPLGEVEDVPVPDANPANGLSTRRSLNAVTAASFGHEWSRRSHTTAGYVFQRHDYVDDLGFDTVTHIGSLEHSRALSRAASLSSSYRYSDATLEDAGGITRPVIHHSLGVGYRYARSLSRVRQFGLAIGGGATYVDTVTSAARLPRRYWAPSGHGSVRLDIARSWSVSADYRRSLTVLDGISAESFFTDALMVTGGGFLAPRVELVLTGAYANGHAGEGVNEVGRYESYNAGAQLRLALTRWWSATVNYQRYDYSLHGVDLPEGLAPDFGRNAVRVGFTFWLPLYGAYTDAARSGRER
jgi:hypothetical protein